MGKTKKITISVATAAVVAIIAVFLVTTLSVKGYRIVRLSDFGGQVSYDRGNDTDVPVYADMSLAGGDTLRTGADESYARLRLDDDKYAFMEESSEVCFTLDSGLTLLDLRYGAITNEIIEKLSPGETYEVKTPNALMAVRGTKFRISCYMGRDGIFYSRVNVFEGTVESRLIYPDGSVVDDVLSVDKGNEALVYYDPSSDITDYVLFDEDGEPVNEENGSRTRSIRYSEIPKQALKYIASRIEEGEESFGIDAITLDSYLSETGYDEPVIIGRSETDTPENNDVIAAAFGDNIDEPADSSSDDNKINSAGNNNNSTAGTDNSKPPTLTEDDSSDSDNIANADDGEGEDQTDLADNDSKNPDETDGKDLDDAEGEESDDMDSNDDTSGKPVDTGLYDTDDLYTGGYYYPSGNVGSGGESSAAPGAPQNTEPFEYNVPAGQDNVAGNVINAAFLAGSPEVTINADHTEAIRLVGNLSVPDGKTLILKSNLIAPGMNEWAALNFSGNTLDIGNNTIIDGYVGMEDSSVASVVGETRITQGMGLVSSTLNCDEATIDASVWVGVGESNINLVGNNTIDSLELETNSILNVSGTGELNVSSITYNNPGTGDPLGHINGNVQGDDIVGYTITASTP